LELLLEEELELLLDEELGLDEEPELLGGFECVEFDLPETLSLLCDEFEGVVVLGGGLYSRDGLVVLAPCVSGLLVPLTPSVDG
jgi:hypothetical protein